MFVSSLDPSNYLKLSSSRARLQDFYVENPTYFEISTSSDKTKFLQPIAKRIEERFIDKNGIRILEIGAGISQLPLFMRKYFPGRPLEIVLQDIVEEGRAAAIAVDAEFFCGDVWDIDATKQFDVVVSLFSFEHMYEPAKVLDALDKLLAPKGVIYIACPHYVAPFYVPPAIRHHSRLSQYAASTYLWLQSWFGRITGRAKFLVVEDPAVFHHAWRRDADAVHMVSKSDLVAYMKSYKVRDIRTEGGNLKSHLFEKATLLFVELEKDLQG